MTRYSVTVTIEGIGKIQHITKAHSPEGAADAIRAAYPGRAVKIEKVLREYD